MSTLSMMYIKSSESEQAYNLSNPTASLKGRRPEASIETTLSCPEYKKFVKALTLIAAGRHPQEALAGLRHNSQIYFGDQNGTNLSEYDFITYLARICVHHCGVSNATISHELKMMPIVLIKTSSGEMAMHKRGDDGWFRIMDVRDAAGRKNGRGSCSGPGEEVHDDSSIVEGEGACAEKFETGAVSFNPSSEGYKPRNTPEIASGAIPRPFEAPVGSRFGILSIEEDHRDEETEPDAEPSVFGDKAEEKAPSTKKNKKARGRRKGQHHHQGG